MDDLIKMVADKDGDGLDLGDVKEAVGGLFNKEDKQD